MAKKLLLTCALLGAFTLPVVSYAAAFQSMEQSAANMGTANAGTGVANDASVEYYNPAAMAFVTQNELAVSAIMINAAIQFQPFYATNLLGQPINGNNYGPGNTNVLPAFYFIHPINDSIAVGMSAESPFGLSTQYNDFSLARYFATTSQIQTVNLNPAISFKLSDQFSFGFGADAEYVKADLNQAIDYQTLNPFATGDVRVSNGASDWGYGWNAGMFYQYSPATKFGLSYRSEVDTKLTGTAKFVGTGGSFVDQIIAGYFGFVPSDVETEFTLPSFSTLSASHQINSWWTIMGDLSYINWSELQSFTLNYTPNGSTPQGSNTLSPQTTELGYHDTYRVAVGQTFQVTPRWLLRMGLAFDQSPITDEDRDARLPDSDRTWLAFGTNYEFTKNINVDFGYAHIFFENSQVDESSVSPFGTQQMLANYNGSANLYGLQLNYNFS